MDARLTIDDREAYDLATRLAELTGGSVTEVVTKALRSELERTEKARPAESETERMLAMGRDIRAHMREPVSSDHSFLYDDNGFPK